MIESIEKKEEGGCFFCNNKLTEVDYKEVKILQRFVNVYMKILPRKRTKLCAKHQRKVAMAVKRARVMAILAFVSK